jgi:hypothetical protein
MTDPENGARNDNPMKILGMIIPALPSLMWRFSGEYLRFRSKARKGGHLFEQQLIDHGVDGATAEKLTEVYLEGSNIFRALFAARQSNRQNK